MNVHFDENGLIVAIAQDTYSGEVRMVAWMNQAALDHTLESGLATFYSRSRQRLWKKGETSGNELRVREVWVDCDADSILLLVEPKGPSCHTGKPSCFFRRLSAPEAEPGRALTPIKQLEETIEERRGSDTERSYTRTLLDAGPKRIADKIREEANELAIALNEEADERVTSEAADLLYHALVGLAARGVSFESVLKTLQARSGISGHDEKRSRGSS